METNEVNELVGKITKKLVHSFHEELEKINPDGILRIVTSSLGEFNVHIIYSIIKSCIKEDKEHLFYNEFLDGVKRALTEKIENNK
jgi:hypothetical protein